MSQPVSDQPEQTVTSPPNPEAGPPEQPASSFSAAFLRRFSGSRSEDEVRGAGPLERYGGLLVLVVMFIVFSATLSGTFPTYENLIGVVSDQTISGIMALSLLLPLAAGVFDISIGGSMTLAVVLVTWLFQTTKGGMPIPVAILITLAVGVLIGCANGLLVVKAKIDPFIATIASSSVLLGISEAIANGTTISFNIPTAFTNLGRNDVWKLPITLIYMLIVAAVIWYILDHTPFGRRVYATGAGREAARLAGVRTNRAIFISLIASATLASLAGVIYAAQIGSGPPNIGSNFLLPAYAAAFLGSTMIKPGRFNVPGLVLALFVVAIGINGLQLYGLPFWIVDIYQGLILIVAVVIARARADKT
jgi:ribose transport system permease protein